MLELESELVPFLCFLASLWLLLEVGCKEEDAVVLATSYML